MALERQPFYADDGSGNKESRRPIHGLWTLISSISSVSGDPILSARLLALKRHPICRELTFFDGALNIFHAEGSSHGHHIIEVEMNIIISLMNLSNEFIKDFIALFYTSLV